MKRLTIDKIQTVISRLVGVEASKLANCFYPAQSKHISEIVKMRQRILPETSIEDDTRYIQWRYNFDPYSSTESALNETRMWVFEIDNEILSVVGVHAINLHCEGSEINSIATMDLLAQEKHEGKGLGVWINLKLQSFNRPVVAMGSNENSVGMVTKLYQAMPHRKIYRKILTSPNYFSKKLGSKRLGKIASFAYQIYLKTTLSLAFLAWNKNFELNQITRFEAKDSQTIDDICMGKISVKRNIYTLNWRIFDFPKEDALVYGIYSNNVLLAYIAVLLNKSDSESTATIIDWGYLQDQLSQKDFSLALTKIQLVLLKNNIGDLTAYAYDQNSAEVFKRSRVHYRDDNSKTLSICLPEGDQFQQLKDFDAWFLTGFDADDV